MNALPPVPQGAGKDDEIGALLRQAANGCRTSFALVYKRTSRRLFLVIWRCNGHRGESEELLQETFVKVWRESWRFDARRATSSTWLTAIARNTALDSLKRRGARPQIATTTGDTDEPGPLDLVECDAPSAHGVLESKERAGQVARALAKLDGSQRQCLLLAFFSGLTHAEIAMQMRVPLGTVKSWIRRALAQLKQPLMALA